MPLTQEENDRLTLVGPGTPMGNLLRRYWQPIGTAAELETEPVQKIRLLGENLTLFRSETGIYGLLGERCPHRGVSFEYGIPQGDGLRCAYHGWAFSAEGTCLNQPFEETNNPEARFKDQICAKSYPVEELGGLIFAYLGPQPAPLLPRWDLLVRPGLNRVVEIHDLPCNWVQCMDNAADPVHFEHLHAVFGNYQLQKLGRPPALNPAKHVKIEFDEFRYGFMKRRLLEGEWETSDEWTVGHPLLFPNILAVGSEGKASLQFRIAIDDTHTRQYAYRTVAHEEGVSPKPTAVVRAKLFADDGSVLPGMDLDNVPSQDMLAWVSQGPIIDRTNENLATSDKGVMLYHWMLNQQMDVVERGDEPMALVRDRADNEPWIDIKREVSAMHAFREGIPDEQQTVDHFKRMDVDSQIRAPEAEPALR